MAPSIVLVPGFCTVGSVAYGPLKAELRGLGFAEVIPVNLASVDALDFLPELQPNPLIADIEQVQRTVKTLVGKGKDVVVVAHSYGGTVALHACEGLWKHTRGMETEGGGVVKAILLSSSITLAGESVASVRSKWGEDHGLEMDGKPEDMDIEVIHDMPVLHPTGLEKGFFADMSAEDQAMWASKALRSCPLGTVMSKAPDVTPADWRISYLVTKDLEPSMPEALQEHLIQSARQAGAEVGEVKYMSSGHFVQVSHAKEVAEWIQEQSK